FVSSADVTRIMLAGIIFYNIFLVLNMDMAGKGKPWVAIYTLVPITIINLLLNYFLSQKLGIAGAAMSSAASMALAAFLYLFFYAKQVNMSVWEIIRPRKSDWEFASRFLMNKRS